MIRLNLTNAPRWIDLGRGVRVEVEPLGSSIDLAARAELPAVDPDEMGLPMIVARRVAYAEAVARRAIRAWEGVADETGADLPVSGAATDALLEQHQPLRRLRLLDHAPRQPDMRGVMALAHARHRRLRLSFIFRCSLS